MHELNEINGRLRDGLVYCRKAYAIFENIRVSNGGVKRLRLRKDKFIKKLIEEILPIARYVQIRYSHGQKIKVKWVDGSQNYDAYLLVSGPKVESLNIPRKQFLEVTTAVHENDHMARKHLNDKGYVFGVKGVSKNKNTNEIESVPHVRTNREAEDDFIDIILDRIEYKRHKVYPDNTTLLIQCMFDTPFLETEWAYIVEKIKNANVCHKFKEIVIFDSNFRYFATI